MPTTGLPTVILIAQGTRALRKRHRRHPNFIMVLRPMSAVRHLRAISGVRLLVSRERRTPTAGADFRIHRASFVIGPPKHSTDRDHANFVVRIHARRRPRSARSSIVTTSLASRRNSAKPGHTVHGI